MHKEGTSGDISTSEGHESSSPNVHTLLKIVIIGVIGFVSVTGNIIALGTLIFHNKTLRTSIYVVIGGLALADIVEAVMYVPEEIITLADKGEIKSDDWCKVYGLLFNSCQYIAAFHLVVLGVLRGILLTDRAHHGPTTVHALITCAVLWIVTLLANIPIVSSSILDPFMKKCVVKSPKDRQNSGVEERYVILSALFSYFLPLFLIIAIYLFTGYISKRFFEDSYSRRERRLSKMITALIVIFALCRLPSELVTLLWFYQMQNIDIVNVLKNSEKYQVWVHVHEYLTILSMLDMALRPVIYATMSREFGIVYDMVINCTYCKQGEEEVAPSIRRRGEIQEVLHAPAWHPQSAQDCSDNEPEEIV